MFQPETFYRERSGARFDYWTYADGERVYLDSGFAEGEIERGRARLVEL